MIRSNEQFLESTPWRTWAFLGAYLAVLGCLYVNNLFAYALVPLAIVAGLQKRPLLGLYLLLIIPCLNVMNNVFFVKDVQYQIASKLALLLLCGMLLLHGSGLTTRQKALQPFAWLFAYTVFMLAMAPWSVAPAISCAKIVLFVVFLIGLVQATKIIGMGRIHATEIRSVFLSVAIFFVLGSAVTIFIPSVGQSMQYSRMPFISDGAVVYGHFNGVTFHSQSLGPALAMLNAFLFADYAFNLRSRGRLHVALLLLIPVLIYHTSSRTAMFGYLASCLIVLAYMLGSRRVAAGKKSQILQVAFLATVCILVIAIIGGTMRNQALAFLVKENESGEQHEVEIDNFGERIVASRTDFIQQQIATFRRHPLIGIGFQVSEMMQQERDFRGLARFLSAPIEKGFAPTMILEEGGIIGALLFIGFLISLFVTYGRLRCFCFLSTFTTFLVTNCGEATLFSPSGIGGVGWVLCFGALQLDLWLVEGYALPPPMRAAGPVFAGYGASNTISRHHD